MITSTYRNRKIAEYKRIIIGFIILFVLALISSCEYNHQEELLPIGAVNPCDTAVINFSTDVSPIITAKCATTGCHDGTGDDPNLSIDVYNQLLPSFNDGKFKSKVLDARTMPPLSSNPLDATEYLKLKCWFEKGHLND